MFLHYFVSSENGEHRSIYIYTIREENQETKRVLTFDPTSFSNRSQRTIRNRSSPPFRSIAAIRGGTLFHEDTLQLPINERAPVFFKWNASRSHNRADLLKERVWAESSVGVPAHFRSTPDLRNDDKFQISRPRVTSLSSLTIVYPLHASNRRSSSSVAPSILFETSWNLPLPPSPSLGLSRDSTPNLGEKETRAW